MTSSGGGPSGLPIAWQLREPPLEVSAALARGQAARRLGGRLVGLTDEDLARLDGVVAYDLLVVLGRLDEVPWVDGISYFGCDAEAPELLMPTTIRPEWPALVVCRALSAAAKGASPVLVDPAHGLLVPLDRARTLSRDGLLGWLGRPLSA